MYVVSGVCGAVEEAMWSSVGAVERWRGGARTIVLGGGYGEIDAPSLWGGGGGSDNWGDGLNRRTVFGG